MTAALQPRHPPRTLAQLLAEPIREHARREAILAPGRAPLTYARLGEQIEATTHTLAACGYGRGSRLAVAIDVGPEFAVAVLALTCAATCAPLNRSLGADGLATLLSAMRIDALVAQAGDAQVAAAAGRASVPLLWLRRSPHDCAGVFELQAQRRREPVPVEPPLLDDVALLGHTSGTTSRPKIVPYEQWRLTEAVRNRAQQRGFSRTDRCLLLSPMHSLGTTRRILVPPLLLGGAVVCPAALDGKSLVDLLEAMAPTQLVASPALLQSMLEEFERRRPRPQHALQVIYAGYAELPAPLRQRLEECFGVPVFMSYGMSETTSIAETPFPPDRAPAGSVGRPATLEVAVADETGRRLAVGETGEILVRGVEVMAGYEDNDEANRQAFFDGWFRTGDAGWIDRDGYVFLSGRLKDILNRGGTKIGPAEVENALTCHPQVAEAAVFGLPHPTLGEDLAAAIVFRPGATVGEPELRAFLRARLPAFKVPAVIFGLVQLPRGSLDKVNRNELVRIAERQLRPDFAAPAAGLETEVAGLFTTALGIPRVSRTDNFFHLGGDSLRGVRVVAGVEEAFGVSVPLDLLFDHPTVASFAAQIEALMGAANRPGA